MTSKMKLLVAFWFTFLLAADAALAAAPGWACFPFAGQAQYNVNGCSGTAPVFAYLGGPKTEGVLAYFLVSVKDDDDNDCFTTASQEFGSVEFGAQLVGGYGASTLRGDGETAIEFAAVAGAPIDQACLASGQHVPWPITTMTIDRQDEDYVLVTVFAPVAPAEAGAGK